MRKQVEDRREVSVERRKDICTERGGIENRNNPVTP